MTSSEHRPVLSRLKALSAYTVCQRYLQLFVYFTIFQLFQCLIPLGQAWVKKQVLLSSCTWSSWQSPQHTFDLSVFKWKTLPFHTELSRIYGTFVSFGPRPWLGECCYLGVWPLPTAPRMWPMQCRVVGFSGTKNFKSLELWSQLFRWNVLFNQSGWQGCEKCHGEFLVFDT